jgi:hypothetical protein
MFAMTTLPHRARLFTAAFVASLIVAAGALPLAAQDAEPDIERAEALEARAASMLENLERPNRAAGLYRQAAGIRGDSDAMKVENLRMASRLGYYAGRQRRAMQDAAAAAHLALRQGDVISASHAYLDAAWIAVEIGEPQRAEHFVREARILTASPLLAEAEREAIRARIVG